MSTVSPSLSFLFPKNSQGSVLSGDFPFFSTLPFLSFPFLSLPLLFFSFSFSFSFSFLFFPFSFLFFSLFLGDCVLFPKRGKFALLLLQTFVKFESELNKVI